VFNVTFMIIDMTAQKFVVVHVNMLSVLSLSLSINLPLDHHVSMLVLAGIPTIW
jgi:hypothetical protein